jgi:DNA-binding NtrC family response regulator
MSKEKVLLVDDEMDFLDALSERLRNRDVEVTTATTGSKALELIRDESYDAIILDMMMPGMDGLETLKAIKADRPELQIILLTGHASVDKGIEAMKSGAQDFIEKPADIKALMDKIHDARDKKMLIVEKKSEERIKEILEAHGW